MWKGKNISTLLEALGMANLPVEAGAGGGSDCRACWGDHSKVIGWPGEIGIISRDQKKVFSDEVLRHCLQYYEG